MLTEEQEVCTFAPSLKGSEISDVFETDYSLLNVQSIEKFLERQNTARQLKEEDRIKGESVVGSGRYWQPTLTKGKAPSFCKESSRTNSVK